MSNSIFIQNLGKTASQIGFSCNSCCLDLPTHMAHHPPLGDDSRERRAAITKFTPKPTKKSDCRRCVCARVAVAPYSIREVSYRLIRCRLEISNIEGYLFSRIVSPTVQYSTCCTHVQNSRERRVRRLESLYPRFSVHPSHGWGGFDINPRISLSK